MLEPLLSTGISHAICALPMTSCPPHMLATLQRVGIQNANWTTKSCMKGALAVDHSTVVNMLCIILPRVLDLVLDTRNSRDIFADDFPGFPVGELLVYLISGSCRLIENVWPFKES